MRDIRFREWDQAREDMIPGHGMSYSEREEFDDSVSFRFEHEEDLDYTGRQSETDCHGTPYRVLEQYTGVDDVSGKPIYEGDIVRADVSENTHFNYKVTFRNGEYIMVSPITNNTKLCSWYQSELNVIGNIHEDGDLIDH